MENTDKYRPGNKTVSLKKNAVYNFINTLTSLLFPLIVLPYASRIMLADGIGKIEFFTSIINYVILFTSLGIPYYAVREIAKIRNNERLLTKTTVEILILHLALSFVGYLAVFVLTSVVAKIQVDIPLFLLLSLSIALTAIGAEWFYKGIEDFKYITIRNVAVRSVCLVLLFLLVKTRDDIMWYAAYTVFGTLGGYIFNFFRLRKFIHLRNFDWRTLSPLSHLRPSLHIFAINFIASIYINLNMVMLGFMTNDAVVGYYSRAIKLSQFALAAITSLGMVMMPRLSHLIASGQKNEFNRLANKSINITLAAALPITVGLIIMAPTLIRLLCGPDFEPAILTLRIIAPVVFFIAVSNVIGIQIFYPQGQENKVIFSTAVGATINLILNIILIPRIAQNGAALGSVMAEASVMLTQFIIGMSFIPFKILNKSFVNYFIGALIMGVGICTVWSLHLSDIANIIIIPLVGTAIYFAFLYFRRDELCLEVISLVKNKISERK